MNVIHPRMTEYKIYELINSLILLHERNRTVKKECNHPTELRRFAIFREAYFAAKASFFFFHPVHIHICRHPPSTFRK
jgi:hypothetical protein